MRNIYIIKLQLFYHRNTKMWLRYDLAVPSVCELHCRGYRCICTIAICTIICKWLSWTSYKATVVDNTVSAVIDRLGKLCCGGPDTFIINLLGLFDWGGATADVNLGERYVEPRVVITDVGLSSSRSSGSVGRRVVLSGSYVDDKCWFVREMTDEIVVEMNKQTAATHTTLVMW